MDAAQVVVSGEQAEGGDMALHLLEEALVNRVNRRTLIRIVRFARSTYEVLTCAASGHPVTAVF